MRRILHASFGVVAGYAAGAAVGAALVTLVSQNSDDKSLEIVMSAFFFGGPFGAAMDFRLGVLIAQRRT